MARTVPVVAITAALLLVSCQTAPYKSYEQRVVDTGKPALHAVHSERLEQVMTDLQRLGINSMPPEWDTDSDRRQYCRKAAEAANAMAESAKHIPEVLDADELDEKSRELFLGLVTKLQQQSDELKSLAEKNRADDIPAAMDQITATCNACHTSFRFLDELEDN